MKFYKQYKAAKRMKVIAGLSHQSKEAAIWWDELDKLRAHHGDDTDAIAEAISDSSKYPSWGIKIGAPFLSPRSGKALSSNNKSRAILRESLMMAGC